jgi:hypothetical protein
MTSAEILAELRSTAPPAPDMLRDRVRTIVAAEGSKRRLRLRAPSLSFSFTPRHVSFAVVGAVLVAALGAAVVRGLTTGESQQAATPTGAEFHMQAIQTTADSAASGAAPALPRRLRRTPSAGGKTLAEKQAVQGAALAPSQLPPASLRLQDYDVELGVTVKNNAALSAATVAAMRWTRAHGGYVARVSSDVPKGGRGASELVLRVPVGQVQAAMQRFAALGTLASDHTSIQDLQGTVNTQTKRIIALNRRIAAILTALGTTQTVENEARLQAELAARKQELAALTAAKRATIVQGRLAHIYLELTTKAAKKHVVAPPHKAGPIERRLDAAGDMLARELAVLLYALVVVAPFALVAAMWLVAMRAFRRRGDRRLLART